MVPGWCLDDVLKVSRGSLEWVFGRCLESVWRVSGGSLEGVWMVSRRCLESEN